MRLKVFALSVTLMVLLSGGVRAKTLEFPKDAPQFAVTFPDDWKADFQSSDVILAQPKDGAYAISIFPVKATNASDAIKETKTEVDKRFQNVKPGTTKNVQTNSNIACLEHDYTATDKGSDRALAVVGFSPDGQKYYALFQAGTPEVDKKYVKEMVAIVKSITPLKAKLGANAEPH